MRELHEFNYRPTVGECLQVIECVLHIQAELADNSRWLAARGLDGSDPWDDLAPALQAA